MYHNIKTLYRLIIVLAITLLPHQVLSQELDWNQLNTPSGPSEIITATVHGEDTLFTIGHDPNNFGVLGFYKSVDFGATWEYVSPDPQPGTSGPGMDLDIDANGNIYHVDRNVLRSIDGGGAWEELDTGRGLFDNDVELEIDSKDRLYLRRDGDKGIFLSEDNGNNWTKVLSPPNDIDGMLLTSSDDIFVYGEFGIKMSSDQGESWTSIYGNELEHITITGDDRVVVTNDKKLSYTDDNGDTWDETEQEFFFNGIASNGNGTLYALGANIGVLISEDGGETWTEESEGLFEPQFGSISGFFITNSSGETMIINHSDPNKFSGAYPFYKHDAENQKWLPVESEHLTAYATRSLVNGNEKLYSILGLRLYQSSDNGDTWQEIVKPDNVSPIAFEVSSNGNLFVGTTSSIYRSQDDGETWQEIPEDNEVSGSEVRASDLYTTDSNIVFTKYLSSLFRFNNEAEEWTRIGDNLDSSPDNVWFNIFNQQLYVSASGDLFTTEDNGDTWIELAPDEVPRVFQLTFTDENIMYATSSSSILKSTDGGNSWTEVADNFNGEMVINADINHFLAYDDGKLAAHANNDNSENTYGFFISEDDGATWSRQHDFVAGSITELQKFESSVYAGTAGLGVYASDGLTSTSTEETANGINDFTLHQNYPNPFNPSTIIKYDIAKASDIRLRVYNVLGQEVAELVHTKQTAGSYSVEFDASNFSSGIYIYRLETDSYSQTRKMLLVK